MTWSVPREGWGSVSGTEPADFRTGARCGKGNLGPEGTRKDASASNPPSAFHFRTAHRVEIPRVNPNLAGGYDFARFRRL